MKQLILIFLVPILAITSTNAAPKQRPNIVVILADDLGYGDIGVYGCRDIPTPHIDSIATNGIRFTDGYATHPVCSPSRAGLMSGMYQHRFGFQNNSGPEEYSAANFGLPRDVPTLAERLKGARYATGMVGKWHIGFKEGLRPHDRGFDYFYGFLAGAHTFLPENYNIPRYAGRLMRNDALVHDEKEYLTDAFARESVDFIDRNKDKPFFLYLAFNAVHSPLESTGEYQERFPDIDAPNRKTYAGMLAAMDDAVGDVMAALRKHDLEENTLVFFYSDNGGPTQETTSRNDPLRGVKGQVFEGGVRIPFVVQWKGQLPAGQVYREMAMGFDVHATALAAAGIEIPQRLDGVDLMPFLTGDNKGRPHDRLFWRTQTTKYTARVGDWKLVRDERKVEGEQLYNLANDIGETTNLASTNPEKLKEMQVAYERWSSQMEPPRWIRQDRSNAEVGGKLKKPSERGKGKTATRKSQPLLNMDKNKDGKLSRDEIPKATKLGQMDANGDGDVTIDEAREYYRARRAAEGKRQ